MIKQFKSYLLEKNKEKERSKFQRVQEMMNFEKAYSIAVMYNASDEGNHNKVSLFVRHLQNMGKNVKAIGFLNYKMIPHYCHAKLSFDFITLSDINWFGKPGGKYVEDFLSSDYDMLIDLNLTPEQSMLYIASLANAKFKIGKFSEENKAIYDFMLQGMEDASLNDFLKELIHYMEVLK